MTWVFLGWRRHTVSLRGRVRRPVTCEECGTEYVYEVERESGGEGLSFYGVDDEGAEARAQERARQGLKEALEVGQDVVPCPKCGRIQADMIALARRDHLRWLDTAGWLAFFLAAAAGFLNLAMGFGAPPHRVVVPWPAVVSVVALGPALVALRYALASAYDPNADDVETRIQRGRRRTLARAEDERRRTGGERGAGSTPA